MPILDLQQRWYSAAELAGLPGMPGTDRGVLKKAGRDNWPSREREGRGGGREYPFTALPGATQLGLLRQRARQHRAQPPTQRFREQQIDAAHERFERLPQSMRDVAMERLQALRAVLELEREGYPLMQARALVSADLLKRGVRGASVANMRRWAAIVEGVELNHWLVLLVPNYTGCQVRAEVSVEAWDFFKGAYLRMSAPNAAICYEHLQRRAAETGWTVPSLKTLQRRIETELPRELRIAARRGKEALDKTYPAMERDRSSFAAMEALNADGHKFDVFVRWPDGTVGRPIMLGWQDLRSGKLVGYSVGPTETSELVRLSFRNVVEKYGIPSKVWLDNGRAFASKLITGGAANRFRFKVKAEDPRGIIQSLVDEVHWTLPYHGQSKPIERAWKDLCETVAKHPAFEGAYTGNKPDAKPENYGSRAVPIQQFMRVLDVEIAAHNARPGRRTRACEGMLSFDQVFNAAYADSEIRKATADQLRQLLLATHAVKASTSDGSVRVAGNRYWCEAMGKYAGKKLMLRIDPERLHASAHVYTMANVYVGEAQCIAALGFADSNAAHEHGRARQKYKRAVLDQLAAELRMSAAQVADQLAACTPPQEETPESKVIVPLFGRGRAPQVTQPEALQATGTDDDIDFSKLLERMERRELRRIGFVPKQPGDE
ncbi:MAG TPA: transposase domain-containing protein [Polyangiaceae bacterium]